MSKGPVYLVWLVTGDGKTCLTAIRRRASLVGLTFTDEHTNMLYRRLETKVFADMQCADSPLYEPALVALLGSKKRKGGACCLVT